jgi:hypothetical protein
VAQAVTQTRFGEECAHTLGSTIEAVGEDPFDPVRRLLLDRRALERAVGLGQGRRTGLLGVAQVPDDTATDDRGQIDLLGETMTVLLIGQEIDGQGQTTSCEDRHQTLVAEGTDQAIEAHGRDIADNGAEFQAEAPMRG